MLVNVESKSGKNHVRKRLTK